MTTAQIMLVLVLGALVVVRLWARRGDRVAPDPTDLPLVAPWGYHEFPLGLGSKGRPVGCDRCGAAVPAYDTARHDQWHREVAVVLKRYRVSGP